MAIQAQCESAAGAPLCVIVKGWGFRFQYNRECEVGGSENPHPCPPRRTRMGHPRSDIQSPFKRWATHPQALLLRSYVYGVTMNAYGDEHLKEKSPG